MRRFISPNLIIIFFIVAMILACGNSAEALKECDIAAIESWTEGDNTFVIKAYLELLAYSNMNVTFVNNLSDLEQKVQQKFATEGCDCIKKPVYNRPW